MYDKKIWEKSPKNVNIPFFSTKNVNFFPVIKQSIPKISTAYSVIVPSMALGSHCGGNFRWLENGIKDCSRCLLPHARSSYSYVTQKFSEISKLAMKNRQDD